MTTSVSRQFPGKPTAASFGHPTDEGAVPMANALQEGLSKDDVTRIYSEWANTGKYDDNMCDKYYKGPYLVSKAVNDNMKDKNIKILDIACGTGFVGEHLRNFGFTNVDGMDAAEGMLNQAKAKNVYKHCVYSAIGPNFDHGLPEKSYDLITICGGFGPGHIPCEAVEEMIKLVKPGGHIFNITRVNHLLTFAEYKDHWEPHIQHLEEQRKWREISRTIFKNYYFDNDGIMYIHEVL